MIKRFMMILACVSLGGLAQVPDSVAKPRMTLEEAREQAESQMDLMLFRIKMFHHEVRATMISSVELPVFKEYFLLPESRATTMNELGVAQFSKRQIQLRKKMEAWSRVLYKRFPIGEACLIDHAGLEHLRAVNGKVEEEHMFSNSEADAPFFAPSFRLAAGEVLASDPYMSPDSLRWVIAYTSPVVLENGEKPAFFHFEVPLDVYGKVIASKDFSYSRALGKYQLDKEEEGWFFLLDKSGLLLADSRRPIRTEMRKKPDSSGNRDDGDYALREKLVDYLPDVASISNDPGFLEATVKMRNGESGEVHLTLNKRAYILLYRPIPGRPWSLGHLDPVGGAGFWEREKR
ncbi:MAG: cache domain-containing protein [Magnetococcales bacterium]|nr:cache domain-containing protein [Magnetococcales bacterium]